MKKIAILQSNYIPWKGYFDLIDSVDEFILFDDAQYTKNDWRNRNKIKTPIGTSWLTIPVRQEKLNQLIKDTKIDDHRWMTKHWKSLQQNYSKAKYFTDFKDIIEELYLTNNEKYLSQINYKFIIGINKILGISTNIRWSSEFNIEDGQTNRLLKICQDCHADTYLTGPSAKEYFDDNLAKQENIKVQWMNYNGYPQYAQLFPPFEHRVSILDLIFNEGSNAINYIRGKQ